MLRILRRSVNKTGKRLYLCRNGHSSAAVLSIKGLEWQPVEFGGVNVNLSQLGENHSLQEFSDKLKESLLQWSKDSRTSVWLKVPIAQSYLIPVAFNHGFSYHHAVGDYAKLLKWLPQWEQSKVPPYATHQVGVSGLVLNRETHEVLVVQDKYMYKVGQTRKANMWKFPGGLSNEGENFEETAIREVWEETGVKAEFKSVLLFRQQHQMRNAFDKSDIYIVCRMEPHSFDISRCEDEIAQCEWMNLSTLITHTEVGPLTKLVGRLAAHGLKHGFDNVDMVGNRMNSWMHPEQTVSLYHKFLP